VKGCLGRDKWTVFNTGGQCYEAERFVNGRREYREVTAHCQACAKVEVLMQYGGVVDLRGWQRQGVCGAFLRAAALDDE